MIGVEETSRSSKLPCTVGFSYEREAKGNSNKIKHEEKKIFKNFFLFFSSFFFKIPYKCKKRKKEWAGVLVNAQKKKREKRENGCVYSQHTLSTHDEILPA